MLPVSEDQLKIFHDHFIEICQKFISHQVSLLSRQALEVRKTEKELQREIAEKVVLSQL